jgi:hypothetical protein
MGSPEKRASRYNASFHEQRKNPEITEIVEIPNRGRTLTIDSGWREVADTALTFIKRFVRTAESRSRLQPAVPATDAARDARTQRASRGSDRQ